MTVGLPASDRFATTLPINCTHHGDPSSAARTTLSIAPGFRRRWTVRAGASLRSIRSQHLARERPQNVIKSQHKYRTGYTPGRSALPGACSVDDSIAVTEDQVTEFFARCAANIGATAKPNGADAETGFDPGPQPADEAALRPDRQRRSRHEARVSLARLLDEPGSFASL
jgi:hypothetical protein